eukprot:COSAG06_NODE_1283_length_10013_cov_81.204156_8_plen_173_part_00
MADRVAPDEQSRTYGNGPGPKYRAAAVEFKQVDVTDLGQVASVTADADAIVHMAAYPFPGPVTEDIVFRTNVMNNWNVLEAAEMNGIRKVIMASSINALGEQPDRLFAIISARFEHKSMDFTETDTRYQMKTQELFSVLLLAQQGPPSVTTSRWTISRWTRSTALAPRCVCL